MRAIQTLAACIFVAASAALLFHSPQKSSDYQRGVNDALNEMFWFGVEQNKTTPQLNLGQMTEVVAQRLGVERNREMIVHAK